MQCSIFWASQPIVILDLYTAGSFIISEFSNHAILFYWWWLASWVGGISWVWPPPSNSGKWRLIDLIEIPCPSKNVIILVVTVTLPETNSSPLKIGHPKRKQSYSNHPLSGALAVSFREGSGKGPHQRYIRWYRLDVDRSQHQVREF